MKKYDSIIIGSGIGGLICATYLAKKGLNALILEKNSKAGGYCQSFERQGFLFEAGPHTMGGYDNNGLLYNILKDLQTAEALKKSELVDRFFFSDGVIEVPQDVDEYKEVLSNRFKGSRGEIDVYFEKLFNLADNFLKRKINPSDTKITFESLLNRYIRNSDLKFALSAHCGYLGLLPENLSAIAFALLEWTYLKEGTYKFFHSSDDFIKSIMAKYFEYGGSIQYNSEVSSIKLESDGKYHKIDTKKNASYLARNLILDIDPIKFYDYSVKESKIDEQFVKSIDKYHKTPSFITSYIGIETASKVDFISGWYFDSYDINTLLTKSYYIHTRTNGNTNNKSIHITRFCSDKVCSDERSCVREKWEMECVGLIKKHLNTIADLNVKTILSADPLTYEKWTFNRCGSGYGYAMTVDQAFSNIFNRLMNNRNIYFVGHWSTFSAGIISAAISGKNIANAVVQNNG